MPHLGHASADHGPEWAHSEVISVSQQLHFIRGNFRTTNPDNPA